MDFLVGAPARLKAVIPENMKVEIHSDKKVKCKDLLGCIHTVTWEELVQSLGVWDQARLWSVEGEQGKHLARGG